MMSSRGIMVILLVVAIMGSWEVKVGTAKKISAAQCKKERRVFVNACKPLLYGKLPSAGCCKRIRITHTLCICQVITPKLAALIDVDRAIRVVKGCGRRIPHNFKCGSITIP